MSVDHWAGHWLSDHSRRETGKITGLRVGARGLCTQLHSQNLPPRQTWPSSQGPSAPRRGHVTHLPPGQPSPEDLMTAPPRFFPHSCWQVLHSFLPRARSHLPDRAPARESREVAPVPWGRARPEAPPTRGRPGSSDLLCRPCLWRGDCKVNRSWQARSFGQIFVPKRVSRSGRSSSSRSSSPNEILSPH